MAADGVYDFVFRVASGQAGTKTINCLIDGTAVAGASYTQADGWAAFHDSLAAGVSLAAESINLNHIDIRQRPGSMLLLR